MTASARRTSADGHKGVAITAGERQAGLLRMGQVASRTLAGTAGRKVDGRFARLRSLTVMARVRDTPLPLSGVRQGAITLELPDELIERIAERVAEIIVEKPSATPEPWLDVAATARHLKISVSQVYSLCSTCRDFPRTKEGSRTYLTGRLPQGSCSPTPGRSGCDEASQDHRRCRASVVASPRVV